VEAPTTTTQPAPELAPEPRSFDLRAEFVQAYGARVFLALSAVGSLFLLPFSINNLLQGRWLLGIATIVVVLCLMGNALAIARGREPAFAPVFIFGPALAALVISMVDQGLFGILWSYPAILLFHFVLPRRTANWFNATVVVVATTGAWVHLGPQVTARVSVTLMLTILLTNIFSYISDAQRRKEAEQRQRLDLLVRGTNAGSLEWDADGVMRYSKRLRQMLGRAYERDWEHQDFLELVHPDDRPRVQAQVMAQFNTTGMPRSIVHQPPDDYRLLHACGDTVWVRTEGIAVRDARGRTRRYISWFMDITEQVRAQETLLDAHEQLRAQAQQLEAQNQQLREAIRVREEVERIARHDLKTPLSSIASVPRLLRETHRPGPREEELLAMVEHAALRVLSMVNLSLDLYRMEEGSYRVRPRAVDLAALAITVARELRGHADSKHVQLRLDLPQQPPAARGEELLCYSIVANLMKNALEAAPERSTVLVQLRAGAREGAEGVSLRIHNAGAVPQPIRASFFDKYATFGKAGGTGLGAYSARLMARVQGGALDMSTGDTEGTVLALWLPLWSQADAPQPEQPPGAGRPQPAGAPAQALPELSLLLVDDDPYNLLVLKSLLPSPPLHLREAVNGRAALDSVAQARPDFIFLDLQMPVMGGPEAILRIRELQQERGQAPSVIVAFSAWDDDVTRQQCADAGFDHYLVKPASREELLAILRGHPAAPDGERVDSLEEDIMALMPAFVASRRELLQRLRDAAQRGDRELLHATAHMLAGSLGMYGFDSASDLSRRICAQARQGELAWLRERCAELSRQFERDQSAVMGG